MSAAESTMMRNNLAPGASHLAQWLSLAATPTFASMAALASFPQGHVHQMSCSAITDMSPLAGMVFMYALMSAFHAPPWLKIISRRGSGAAGHELVTSGPPVSAS